MRVRRFLVLTLVLAWVFPALGQSELVITREGSKEYHRPGCPVIKDGKNVLAMRRADAEAKGLTAHKECDPSYVPPPPRPTMVFIDKDGKYYHRAKCEKLGKEVTEVTIDEAVKKKRWPCTTCKPPIRSRPKGNPK